MDLQGSNLDFTLVLLCMKSLILKFKSFFLFLFFICRLWTLIIFFFCINYQLFSVSWINKLNILHLHFFSLYFLYRSYGRFVLFVWYIWSKTLSSPLKVNVHIEYNSEYLWNCSAIKLFNGINNTVTLCRNLQLFHNLNLE